MNDEQKARSIALSDARDHARRAAEAIAAAAVDEHDRDRRAVLAMLHAQLRDLLDQLEELRA